MYENNNLDFKSDKLIRQVEKDETFWTASSLMTLYYSPNKHSEFKELLIKAYGENPPLKDFTNWDKCLEGEIFLYFETNISSPRKYKNWLKENVEKRNFIPYILDNAKS